MTYRERSRFTRNAVMRAAAAAIAIPITVSPAMVSNRAALYSNTGVAPFLVQFHACGTTDTETTNPFRDCTFIWNFGDAGAGAAAWGQGADAARSRNYSYGPTAGHVYETPGTYTVTLQVTSALTGNIDSVTTTITVLDPAVVYAGTKTICFSNNTDFTGAPAGATLVTTTLLSDITARAANGVRLLGKRGDTYTSSSSTDGINFGTFTGGTLGAYGTGAAPIATNSVSTSVLLNIMQNGYDWRYMDWQIVGSSANRSSRGITVVGSASGTQNYVNETLGYCCLLRLSVTGVGNAMLFAGTSHGVQDSSFSNMYGEPGVFPGTLGLNSGNVGIYSIADGMQFFYCGGNSFDRSNTGEHCARFQGLFYAKFESSRFKGANATKTLLATRGMVGASAGMLSGNYCVSNCVFDPAGSTNMPEGFQAAPQNGSLYEPIQNVLIEHNYFLPPDYNADYYSYNCIVICAKNVTYRHNVINASSVPSPGLKSGVQAAHVQGQIPGSPTPGSDNFVASQNSAYSSTQSRFTFFVEDSGCTSPTNCVVKNNVAYTPNATSNSAGNGVPTIATLIAGSPTVVINNSTDSQIKTTDPLFSAPTSYGGFTLGAGSYALAAGLGINYSPSAI